MQSHQQRHGSINNEHQINLNEPQLGPKKKRNLPGMPDPDAEVVALSPNTLMATYRFICEICNKGFQRDQNLQLHRRGHDLPWKLKQRTSSTETRKRVYICPDTSCVHHHPSRALGDLTGIKKHFCRKHGEKKWKCDKCSKKYAVKSDWKSHYKTCGTREYRCDCGIFFSRRDSFITHRAFCDALAEESAKYCASNMPTIEPSATLNLTNSYFRPSETLVFPGETHIFEKKSGKADTQGFPASWESVIADRYCNAADDQQLPISVGQRDELFQVNGYCNQLSAIAEQHIYPSENGRPTTSMTYYGRDQIYKGEAKTLPSHDFQLEKLHDSVTRFAPSINGCQDSDLIAPIAFGSIIQFPETQKMVQFNPNGLSLRPNHNRLDFNASGMQMNPSTLNSEGFPSGFPSDRGVLPLGSGDASYLGSPSIQPSCPHSSATALLQQAAEMGARISNSDLFKTFDVEGTGTVSVPESAVINLRIPFEEKSGKEVHSASTLNSSQILFSRCTGDIPFMHKDLHNSWSLPEERRTPCKLPEIPESGVWNHLNRCTKIANETFGNYLEKDVNASETKCSVNGIICRTESQLATFLVDSGHDPFTRDFLGVTRKASNITSMADSEAYHPGLSKIPWQGVTAKSWLQ